MDTPVDIWHLRGKIDRPPPIVMLSACDTHAADRNHATSANGFLSIGTRAVLGTIFPIDARTAAIFTTRLLYRVAEFIPSSVGVLGRALTWTEIVCGMLKMQFLTDFLRHLMSRKLITEEIYFDIHPKGNYAINSGHDNPFQAVFELLIVNGVDEAIARRELEVAVANSETISYLNMGRPETIMIGTEALIEGYLGSAANTP
jgi:hypothetical protein